MDRVPSPGKDWALKALNAILRLYHELWCRYHFTMMFRFGKMNHQGRYLSHQEEIKELQ